MNDLATIRIQKQNNLDFPIHLLGGGMHSLSALVQVYYSKCTEILFDLLVARDNKKHEDTERILESINSFKHLVTFLIQNV